MRTNRNFKVTDIKAKDVTGNISNVAATFGGLVIGKGLGKVLDKFITSNTVKGLVGIEVSENIAKWSKPLIITGVGAGAVVYGGKKGNLIIQNLGLGIGAIGISEIGTIITGKNALAGFEDLIDSYDDNQIAGYKSLGQKDFNSEYQVIDMATGRQLPASPGLNLPVLNGGFGDTRAIWQNYDESDLSGDEDYDEDYDDNLSGDDMLEDYEM